MYSNSIDAADHCISFIVSLSRNPSRCTYCIFQRKLFSHISSNRNVTSNGYPGLCLWRSNWVILRNHFFRFCLRFYLEKSRTEKNADKEDKGSTDIKAFESLIKTFFDCVQVIKVVAIPHYQTKRYFCCNLISWSWIRNSSPIALIALANKQGGVTSVQKILNFIKACQ